MEVPARLVKKLGGQFEVVAIRRCAVVPLVVEDGTAVAAIRVVVVVRASGNAALAVVVIPAIAIRKNNSSFWPKQERYIRYT